jgi:serine/threonine protein kinase
VNRKIGYSFVICPTGIVLFYRKVDQDTDLVSRDVITTGPLNLENGMPRLIRLLKKTPSELGYCQFPLFFDDISLGSLLGYGTSSHVYQISTENPKYQDCVLKVFHNTTDLQIERKILQHLTGKKGIPKVKDTNENQMLLWPKGLRIGYFDQKKIKELVDILYIAHNVGVLHRDIRPENIIVYKGTVYIIDWSFAVDINHKEHYKGTITYASPQLLKKIQNDSRVEYLPSDDLKSLIYVVLSQNKGSEVTKTQKEEWEMLYPDLFQNAENTLYDKLCQQLCKLVAK